MKTLYTRMELILKTFAQKIRKHWWFPVFCIVAAYISLLYLLVILDMSFLIDRDHNYLLLLH